MNVPQHISSHITRSVQSDCTRMWSNPPKSLRFFSCGGHVETSDISKLAQTLIVKCCLFTKIRAHVFKEYIIHIHTRITSWASRVRRNNVYISLKCFRFSHSTIVRLILFQPIKAVLKGRIARASRDLPFWNRRPSNWIFCSHVPECIVTSKPYSNSFNHNYDMTLFILDKENLELHSKIILLDILTNDLRNSWDTNMILILTSANRRFSMK